MKAVGSSHFVTKDCAHTLPDVIATITGRPITKDYLFRRYRLTRKEAESLREKWISEGNLPCDHISLSLKQTDTGYLMAELALHAVRS